MFGLTTLGVFHTAIGLAALIGGSVALARYKEISSRNALGQFYLLMTLVAAVTSLAIFQHGSFGPPHVLALLTLAALAVGTVAAAFTIFGRASRYIQAISYSSTFLFHLIPGFTESLTRLPRGAPIAESPQDPIFQVIYPALLIVFLIGIVLQIRWLRAHPR